MLSCLYFEKKVSKSAIGLPSFDLEKETGQ